ncbi:GNAT family N-acetyltransferase [Pseudomonas juntendi]|uniref:GNAT family N-acetyltransferase n=1 Tax=Pseudomonas juntendi TaxID=2666183 RepID=UPI0018D98CB2|nr:GNAT family N-acetyltransferase [Pseudomonas juntendi]MBH3382816.1 GNAT family N-acetyltransferase [Pseudomonas juntendi]
MQEVSIEQWHENYRQDFVSLSLEWLAKYVSIEPIDLEILNDPEGYILSKGGAIFFARLDGETVGTVAMIPSEGESFELAKLAVTEKYKGLRIGQLLMERCIEFAKEREAKKIFLFTTSILVAAVNLYRRNAFEDVDLADNKYVEADMRMELVLRS